MPINNECRDNLGYVMAEAMGFDLFAFVFWGWEEGAAILCFGDFYFAPTSPNADR